MGIVASVFVIALGAVLRYVVSAEFIGVGVDAIGTILMLAGGFGILLTLFMMAARSRDDDVIGYRSTSQIPAPPPRRNVREN